MKNITVEKVVELKEKIENSKTKVAKLQGEQKGILKQIKELGYNSIEEVEEGIHKIEERNVSLQKEIKSLSDSIKKELECIENE